jgi:hypothetical protein
MHVPFPQNLQWLRGLQSHEQRAELRCGRMQKSVTSLLFVNSYTSHSSTVNTSQPITFFNYECLNPERLKTEHVSLQSYDNVVYVFYILLLLYLYLLFG